MTAGALPADDRTQVPARPRARVSNRLEWAIAWRYLRSRKGSRLLSFISVVAIGGVVVGVSALILIMGVMNGLQNDLRDKILVGSPDLRVLNYGQDLKIDDWQTVLDKVKAFHGVVAAAPFVLTQGLVSAGHNYVEAAQVMGIDAPGPACRAGDHDPATRDARRRGLPLRELRRAEPAASSWASCWPSVWRCRRATPCGMLAPPAGGKINPVLGTITPRYLHVRGDGTVRDRDVRVRQLVHLHGARPSPRSFAGLGAAVTGHRSARPRTGGRRDSGGARRSRRARLPVPDRGLAGTEQLTLPGAQAREVRDGLHRAASSSSSRRSTS